MIDPAKKYRTRDGREVRIYAVDGREDEEVHGAFLTKDGWVPCGWSKSGLWCEGGTDNADLIEVRPRIQREVWVNVYPDGLLCYHDSREKADGAGKWCGRIACVKLVIDCEEGEGL